MNTPIPDLRSPSCMMIPTKTPIASIPPHHAHSLPARCQSYQTTCDSCCFLICSFSLPSSSSREDIAPGRDSSHRCLTRIAPPRPPASDQSAQQHFHRYLQVADIAPLISPGTYLSFQYSLTPRTIDLEITYQCRILSPRHATPPRA